MKELLIKSLNKRVLGAGEMALKILLACALTLSAGCNMLFGDDGWFPDRQSDYLKAQEEDPIKLPEGVNAEINPNVYPIPELEFSSVLPEKYVLPRVEPLGDVESRGSVRIQRLLEDRWILVNRSPTQTWPLVIEFLQDNQVDIAVQNSDAGYLETEWLKETSIADADLEKYRFFFDAGVQSETTEVLIKQLYQSNIVADPELQWKASSDDGREENMTKLLANFLASSPESVSHSLLAQGISTANKASLNYGEDGSPYIALQLPYQRGWASLALALRKADFEVVDTNRDDGRYFANFDPAKREEKKRNWLSRVIFPKDDELVDVRGEYLVDIERGQDSEVLSITISREGDGSLQNNEQAFLLNRILTKLS